LDIVLAIFYKLPNR